MEKGRVKKWSTGLYKIIDRQGNHYLVIPLKFDSKEYCKAQGLKYFNYSEPVYFRKNYELKYPEPDFVEADY